MGFFKKGELRVLWPFYVESIIATAFFVMVPFMVPYFLSIGLSAFQIGMIMAVWPLSKLIFEVPTGAIADIYGRKFSVILGWILEGLILISMFFANSYHVFLALFALWGLAQTLSSGSYDAWVVDLLKAKKMNTSVKDFFAKKMSFLNLGFVLSGFIGAFFVAKFGLKSIWPVSGIAYFVSIIFLFMGQEIYEKQKHVSIGKSFISVYNQAKKAIDYSAKHRVLFYLLFAMFLVGASMGLNSIISWTTLLKEQQFPDYGFGYLWSASAFIGIISPLLANKLTKHKKERNTLIFLAAITFLFVSMVLFSSDITFLVILYMLALFPIDILVPVWSTYLHRFTPTKIRATIGGVQGMVFSLAGAIFFPIAGFLIDTIGPKYTIFSSGLLMIPVILLYMRIKE